MESINPNVNNLFRAYTLATGFDMALNMASERWLIQCISEGMTAGDLTMAVTERKKWNQLHDCKKSLLLHKMVRDEEDRAILWNEIAEAKSRQRIKVMDAGKASVLKATHRPTEMPSTPAKAIGDVKLLSDLRKAAQ